MQRWFLWSCMFLNHQETNPYEVGFSRWWQTEGSKAAENAMSDYDRDVTCLKAIRMRLVIAFINIF